MSATIWAITNGLAVEGKLRNWDAPERNRPEHFRKLCPQPPIEHLRVNVIKSARALGYDVPEVDAFRLRLLSEDAARVKADVLARYARGDV